MKVFIALLALVALTVAERPDCYEKDPAFCALNAYYCHISGHVEQMKKACPRTCGYCYYENDAGDKDVMDMAAEYIEAKVTNVEGIPECMKAYHECRAGAHSPRERLMCVVSLAKCAGGDIAKCASQCLPPFLGCMKEAGPAPMKKLMCFMTIVKCISTECKKDYLGDEEVMDMAAEYIRTEVTKVESIPECLKAFGLCQASAHGARERLMCVISLAKCAGGEIAQCVKTCVPPFIACIKDAGETPLRKLMCYMSIVKCVSTECRKDSLADVNALITPPSVSGDIEYDDVLEACKTMFGACMGEAHGNPIRMIQCTGQFAICSAMKIVGCSKQCIPPMLQCHIGAIGNWPATFKCCADFIKCAIGGCLHPGNTVQLISSEATEIEEAMNFAVSPASINDCLKAEQACIGAADTLIAKVKCVVVAAQCLAGETVKCAKTCAPAFVSCVKDAGLDVQKLVTCSKNVITCIKKCKGDVALEAKVDEAIDAIYSTIEDPEKVSDCIDAVKSCVADAGGIIGKIHCAATFAKCVATEAAQCGLKCTPPFIECVRDAGFDLGKITGCISSMVSCVQSCQEDAQIEKALATIASTVESPEKLADCVAAVKTCLADAEGFFGKIKCAAVFAKCVADDAAQCGLKCTPPFVECIRDAGFDLGKVTGCLTSMISCVESCQEDIIIEEALSTLQSTVEDPEKISDCITAVKSCIADSQGLLAKMVCLTTFARCIATEAAACGQKCIPPLVECVRGSGFDIGKLMGCVQTVIACVNECKGDLIEHAVEDAINTFHEIIADPESVQECISAEAQCMSEADGYLAKIRCLAALAACIGKEAQECGAKCLPPFVECIRDAGLDIMKVTACGASMITCVKDCAGGIKALAIAEPYAPYQMAVDFAVYEETDNGIIEVIKECQEGHTKCMSEAGTMGDKAKCFLTFGWCIARKVAGCSKSCIPGMAICLMGAHGNPIKTFLCATNFIRCVKHECNEPAYPDNPVLAMAETNEDIHKILSDCSDANAKCMAAADPGVKGKALCYVKYGYCIATGLAKCSAGCLPKFAICSMRSTGNWMALLHCGMDFVKCAKESCTSAALLLE